MPTEAPQMENQRHISLQLADQIIELLQASQATELEKDVALSLARTLLSVLPGSFCSRESLAELRSA